MLIRRIEKRDDAKVAYIIRACLTEYGQAGNPNCAWADPHLDHFSAYYVRGDNAYWVAENDDGEVVAGAGIGPLDGEDGVCELQKMYCLAEYRGCGMAQALLDRALEFAAEHYKRCYIETFANMGRAQNFYKRNGFTPIDHAMGSTGHTACECWYIKEL